MKDFYLRLGLYPNAGDGLLADAIEAYSNKAVQRAARSILLTPSKRAQYNAAHAQLKRIAQLRSNLGLRRTELWTECEVADFDVEARGHHSQLKVLRDSVAWGSSREPEPARESRDWTPHNIRKAVALVAGLAPFVWWLLPNNSSVRPRAQQEYPITQAVPPAKPATEWHRPTYEEVFGNRPSTPPATSSPASSPPDDPWVVSHELPEPKMPIADSDIPMPMTGALTAACRYRSDWPELRITSGESAGDFFVRIVTFDSSIERCRAFVRTGETARLSLRDGSYEVRYASGPRWYGENQLFGEETELLKGTDPITLRVISMSGGYQLQGGELILEKQIGGNFPDQAISPTEFFE